MSYPHTRAAKRFGISVEAFVDIKEEVRQEQIEGISSENTNDTGSTYDWRNDPNFEAHCEERGIDPAKIVSVKFWQSASGSPRYSIVTDERIQQSEEDREAFRDALLSDIRKEMQTIPQRIIEPAFPESGNMSVFHFCDLHLGKDAWTLEEATEKIQTAFEYALLFAKLHRSERIHIPLGHDLLQIDYEHISRSGTMHTTSSGTPVTRSNNSWRDLYRAGRKLGSWMILRALQEGISISVDVIPGNHSEQSEIAMGDAWQMQFEDNPNVTIRLPEGDGYDLALQWGKVGIMETHGHTTKFEELPTHFAFRYPHIFCHSEFRYVITGHKHISQKKRVGDWTEDRGCSIYISPSLSPQDLWHKKYGFDGIPGFDIFTYNKETGPIGHYQHRIPQRQAA